MALRKSDEKRLIDANALMKRFYNYYDCVNEFTSKNGYRGDTLMDYEVADMIYDCIEDAPTVDAVEVVRCKDCKHFDEHTSKCHVFSDNEYIVQLEVDSDHFCSYGERREGE